MHTLESIGWQECTVQQYRLAQTLIQNELKLTVIILKTVCAPWTSEAKLMDTFYLNYLSTKDIRPSPSMLTLSPPHYHKQVTAVISLHHLSFHYSFITPACLCVIILFTIILLGPSSLMYCFCLCFPFCWALPCRFSFSMLSWIFYLARWLGRAATIHIRLSVILYVQHMSVCSFICMLANVRICLHLLRLTLQEFIFQYRIGLRLCAPPPPTTKYWRRAGEYLLSLHH